MNLIGCWEFILLVLRFAHGQSFTFLFYQVGCNTTQHEGHVFEAAAKTVDEQDLIIFVILAAKTLLCSLIFNVEANLTQTILSDTIDLF